MDILIMKACVIIMMTCGGVGGYMGWRYRVKHMPVIGEVVMGVLGGLVVCLGLFLCVGSVAFVLFG